LCIYLLNNNEKNNNNPQHSQYEFYKDLANEHLAGKKLYTCLAVTPGGGKHYHHPHHHKDDDEEVCWSSHTATTLATGNIEEEETIVSCLVGSFVHASRFSRHLRSLLLPDSTRYRRMFYIMTLGTITAHRQMGLGSAMVEYVESSLVQQDPTCGGIYLHVITHNKAAIRFYERLGFHFVEEISDYYEIEGQKYASYLYAKYLNGNRGHYDVFAILGRAFYAFWRQVSHWIPSSLMITVPSTTTTTAGRRE
jgi:ribosomal protein S18 acetylase RimI-like enzyme